MRKLLRYFRSQRSQAMTEFALIAPVLLLLIFGTVDFGRALYYYITLQQAANEGARVAVRASYYTDPSGTLHNWPNNADIQAAVAAHAVAVLLANPCPNGPIPAHPPDTVGVTIPPQNQGWIFITDPSPQGNGTPNAPRGQTTSTPGCNTAVAATGNEPLKVTIRYNFVPLTPLIQQVTADHLILEAYAVYRAEYAN